MPVDRYDPIPFFPASALGGATRGDEDDFECVLIRQVDQPRPVPVERFAESLRLGDEP